MFDVMAVAGAARSCPFDWKDPALMAEKGANDPLSSRRQMEGLPQASQAPRPPAAGYRLEDSAAHERQDSLSAEER